MTLVLNLMSKPYKALVLNKYPHAQCVQTFKRTGIYKDSYWSVIAFDDNGNRVLLGGATTPRTAWMRAAETLGVK